MLALFTGIETFGWSQTDVDTCIAFMKANGIDTWYLKCYEITQGYWYDGPGSTPNTFNVLGGIKKQGINVIPYGFFYGDDPLTEGKVISDFLSRWGSFCIDVEGSFDNAPDKMQRLVDQISKTGTLYCSTWANPNTHNYTQCLKILDKIVDVWMPQCYDDSLLKEFLAQWISSIHPVQPTFHVVDTPYNDAKSFTSFSLWEYQLATQNIGSLQSFIQIGKGNSVGTYPTNSVGAVANFLPTPEFQPGKSEFECGAFAVSLCGRATNYNVNNINNPYNQVMWAEHEYAKTTGNDNPGNMVGASIQDMWTMLKDTQVDDRSGYHPPNVLHYWDISSITATSTQANDIAQIKAAIQHGYPVIATVSEKSVYDVQLKSNPYWWGASGNHILIWAGIAPSGNLLAVDPANVIRGDGNLQTSKSVQPWPREYDIRSIDNQWATIVKMPWLPDIPSDNPVSWPPYSVTPPPPPPDPIVAVTVTYDEASKQIIFSNNNQVILRQQVQ